MSETPDAEVQLVESSLPGLPPDWPQQATTRVVGVVDSVRSKTTGPAIRISRAIVYGIVAAILALVASPLLLIGFTRFLNWAIPGEVGYTYLVMGTVLSVLGLLMWRKRPRGAANG